MTTIGKYRDLQPALNDRVELQKAGYTAYVTGSRLNGYELITASGVAEECAALIKEH